MPIVGNTLPPRPATASSGSANATTKVHLEDDTHDGTIVAISFFHEDTRNDDGTVKNSDPNSLNMVRVKVQVGEAILSRKMTNSTYENSNFAKFLAAATGIALKNEAALSQVDTDTLIGKPIRVLTCFNPQSGYTNIDKFLAPKRSAASNAAGQEAAA